MLWILRRQTIVGAATIACICIGLLLAIIIVPSATWSLIIISLFLGIATLHLILWSNIRKHLGILSRQINAVQALGTLQSLPLNQPAFLLTHSVTPDLLVLIGECFRRFHIQRVLELGSGASSLYLTNMLQYFCGGGTLISLEDSEAWHQLIQVELNTAILGTQVSAQVLYSPIVALEDQRDNYASFYSLPPALVNEKKGFDLIFIDGPADVHLRINALDILLPYASHECIIVWDDGEQAVIRTSIERFVAKHSDWSFKYYNTVKGTCIMYRLSNQLPLP